MIFVYPRTAYHELDFSSLDSYYQPLYSGVRTEIRLKYTYRCFLDQHQTEKTFRLVPKVETYDFLRLGTPRTADP